MLIFIFISVLYHYNCSNLTRTILSYLDYSDFYMPVYYFIFLCLFFMIKVQYRYSVTNPRLYLLVSPRIDISQGLLYLICFNFPP